MKQIIICLTLCIGIVSCTQDALTSSQPENNTTINLKTIQFPSTNFLPTGISNQWQANSNLTLHTPKEVEEFNQIIDLAKNRVDQLQQTREKHSEKSYQDCGGLAQDLNTALEYFVGSLQRQYNIQCIVDDPIDMPTQLWVPIYNNNGFEKAPNFYTLYYNLAWNTFLIFKEADVCDIANINVLVRDCDNIGYTTYLDFTAFLEPNF